MAGEKKKIADHEYWCDEETGFYHLAFVGVLDAPEIIELNLVFRKWQEDVGKGEPTFVLVDNRRSDGISGDGRKAMAKNSVQDADVYCSIYGASFAVRVVLNLVFKAMSLSENNRTIVRYASSESDAREWLTEHRRAYLARKR